MKILLFLCFFTLSITLVTGCKAKKKDQDQTDRENKTEDILETREKTSVNLVTLEWEPFIGTKLKDDGFITKIVEESFRAAGYRDIQIDFYPWKRCMEMGKKGEVDGVIGAWFNEERAEQFYFSESMVTNKKMFFKLKESAVVSEYNSLKDLSNYRIGIIRGYTYSEEFDTADYLVKDEANDIKMLFKKLVGDRVDIVVASYYPTLYILEHELALFKPDVEVITPPLKEDPLYVIFPKQRENSSRIRDDFNKGLEIIQNSGKFDAILEEHGF